MNWSLDSNQIIGDLLILLSAILLAISILWIRHISIYQPSVNPLTATLWQITFSLPFFWFATIFEPSDTEHSVTILPLFGLIYHGLIITLAIFFRSKLVVIYDPGIISSFFFLTPSVASILGWLLLGEKLTVSLFLGAIATGIGILFIYSKNKYLIR